VIKWKCSVCLAKRESEVKPVLYQRLCEDCKVTHYTNLVGIYKYSGDSGFRQEEARLLLKQAQAELKAYRAKAVAKWKEDGK
jgi:hypothetical protein